MEFIVILVFVAFVLVFLRISELIQDKWIHDEKMERLRDNCACPECYDQEVPGDNVSSNDSNTDNSSESTEARTEE